MTGKGSNGSFHAKLSRMDNNISKARVLTLTVVDLILYLCKILSCSIKLPSLFSSVPVSMGVRAFLRGINGPGFPSIDIVLCVMSFVVEPASVRLNSLGSLW
jgi:hypothetical protein